MPDFSGQALHQHGHCLLAVAGTVRAVSEPRGYQISAGYRQMRGFSQHLPQQSEGRPTFFFSVAILIISLLLAYPIHRGIWMGCRNLELPCLCSGIPTSLKLTRACVVTDHAMALSVMTEEFTMRGLAYNPGILPAEMIIRQRVKPMPSREELLKRNSFPSVNQNKYLNAMWCKGGSQ